MSPLSSPLSSPRAFRRFRFETPIPVARLLLGASLLVGLGCKDSDPPPTEPLITISGPWSGTISQGGANTILRLQLNRSDQTVTGTGTVISGSARTFTITSGSFVNPTLTLRFESQGLQPFTLNGTLSKTPAGAQQIEATLNGSGFTNTFVRLSPG